MEYRWAHKRLPMGIPTNPQDHGWGTGFVLKPY